ncbi:MAG: hypothetical protein MZU84_03490 [Sphingobacterium sp.]|nr:hypothetical protein [Sphingobacterium sp.]
MGATRHQDHARRRQAVRRDHQARARHAARYVRADADAAVSLQPARTSWRIPPSGH